MHLVLCGLVNLNGDCELELCRVSDLLRFGRNFEIFGFGMSSADGRVGEGGE